MAKIKIDWCKVWAYVLPILKYASAAIAGGVATACVD